MIAAWKVESKGGWVYVDVLIEARVLDDDG